MAARHYVIPSLPPPSLPLPFLLLKALTTTGRSMLIFKTHRDDFRGATILALGPSIASTAQWTRSAIPTLANAEVVLKDAVRGRCPHWHVALLDATNSSPLDTTHGHYEPILAELSRTVPNTIPAMSQAFTEMIAPLGTAKTTRGKAQRNWRTVLTWATARGALQHILPMAPSTLHAMLWDFSAMGSSRSTLKAIVDAVITRHRDARVDSPVSGHMTYSRLARCLGRLLGKQHPHKLAITRDMVAALLRYKPKNLVEFRNKMTLCTLTIGCMRPCEGARATTCCLIFNADFLKGLREFQDCSTLTTVKRKQDQERKGHWMRFGKSTDPELDINHQLGLFLDMTGTRPRTNCQGVALQGRKCLTCPPLFPKLKRASNGTWTLHPSPEPSPTLITSMVVAALRMIGVDTTSFSGVCCRMGGLTVATEAGVPENIMWMQSGHAQDKAARRYVRLTSPDKLYDTWRAFRL